MNKIVEVQKNVQEVQEAKKIVAEIVDNYY